MEVQTLLPYLSEEIILDILCRLPVKSLVRFRCVCKDWFSLFSNNPKFVACYRSTSPAAYVYLLKYPTNELNFGMISDCELNQVSKVSPPVCIDPTVVGSIDGVFCLVNSSSRFILWNPSTRDFYYPPCPNIHEDDINKSFFGFARCDNGLTSPFSIVRIVRKKCRHQWRDGDPYCCTPEIEAEMYDSNVDTWIDIGSSPKSFLLCNNVCSVIVQGVSYWCTYAWCASIISFNPSLKKFSEFDGPGSSVEGSSLGWSLGEISGSLVAFMQKEDEHFVMWKMVGGGDEALWVKQYSMALPSGVGKVVKCLGDGEFVIVSVVNYSIELVVKLILYNPSTQTSRLLLEFPAQKEKCLLEVFLYVESLISPRGYITCV